MSKRLSAILEWSENNKEYIQQKTRKNPEYRKKKQKSESAYKGKILTKMRIGERGSSYKYVDSDGNSYGYCKHCDSYKPLDKEHFHTHPKTKSGFRSKCKICENESNLKRIHSNPGLKERMNEDSKKWRKNNIERDRKNKRNLQREKMKDPKYRKKYNEYHRKYRKKNRDIITKNQRDYDQRVREDPVRYNSKRIRSSFSCFLDKCCKPEDKTDLSTEEVFEICGYTIEEFKRHIESQFHSGMTWENQSTFWHIDHIVPLARLASDDPNSERTKYAWGLHNLRPMLAQRNLDKSSLYEGKRWTYEEGLVTPFKLPNEDRYI